MFTSLGNIVSSPPCAMVFVDFASGHILQLSGQGEIQFTIKDNGEQLDHSERMVFFTVTQVCEV